jgi:citrate synthase
VIENTEEYRDIGQREEQRHFSLCLSSALQLYAANLEEVLMAQVVNFKNTGLRGVTVADTKVSFIDGEKGVLIYRGYRIEDLAEHATFTEVAHLLLNGFLPGKKLLEDFERKLREARALPEYIIESFGKWPKEATPMDVLQASVPLLAMADPDLPDESREANFRMALRLIARFPAVVAAWHRTRNGLDHCRRSSLHAANFCSFMKKPDEEAARYLDTASSSMPTTPSTLPRLRVAKWFLRGRTCMPVLQQG